MIVIDSSLTICHLKYLEIVKIVRKDFINVSFQLSTNSVISKERNCEF